MVLSDELNAEAAYEDGAGVGEAASGLHAGERRMHVRAYNHWVSLLRGRPCPVRADLRPAAVAGFAAYAVLIDFTGAPGDPVVSYLGDALREECGVDGPAVRVADVPPRSLLSRLTERWPRILADRAPVGFDAKFVNARGRTTLYRGILMPFSSTGAAIDLVYGVINWKELADPLVQASLDHELAAAVRAAPAPSCAPVWADGPSGALVVDEAEAPPALADRTALARVDLPAAAEPGRLLLLVSRARADGALDVLASLDDAWLTARAIEAVGEAEREG